MNSFRNAELILLVLLALFGLSLAWTNTGQAPGIDFYQFWVVGRALGRPDVSDIYSPEERVSLGHEFNQAAHRSGDELMIAAADYRRELETYSSPFLYTLFSFGSTGSYSADLRNYRALMLACLVVAVVLFARLADHSWSATLGAIALLSAWYSPSSSELRVANVNSLQLAALAAYLWILMRLTWRHRDLVGGALVGLALAFKPNVVLAAGALAVYWILNGMYARAFRQAVGAAGGVLIAVALSAFRFGSLRGWMDWVSAVRSLPDEIITVELGNYSPARILSEGVGIDVSFPLSVLLLLVTVTMIWQQRRALRGHKSVSMSDGLTEMHVFSIGCLLIALVPRLAWLHYYIFAIPLILFLLRPLGDFPSRPQYFVWHRLLLALALVGLAVTPMQNVGIQLSPSAPLVPIVLPALIIFMIGLRELVLVRPRAQPARNA